MNRTLKRNGRKPTAKRQRMNEVTDTVATSAAPFTGTPTLLTSVPTSMSISDHASMSISGPSMSINASGPTSLSVGRLENASVSVPVSRPANASMSVGGPVAVSPALTVHDANEIVDGVTEDTEVERNDGDEDEGIHGNAAVIVCNKKVRVPDRLIQVKMRALGLAGINEEFISMADRQREKNTLGSYEKHYKGLWNFLELIGDHESRIILLEIPPVNAPPMHPRSIALYMVYKRSEKNAALTDKSGKILKTVKGKTILCAGGWKAPINETQFKSAISTLHHYRGHGAEYESACSACVHTKAQNSNSVGCNFHAFKPRFHRTGNPTLSVEIREFMAAVTKATGGYVPHGSQPLNPWQLRQYVYALVSENKPWKFMFAVMSVVASNLYLREDEIAKLKISDIHPTKSFMNADGIVEYICIGVSGKRDNNLPVYLTLWPNRKNKILCPITMLLWWLSLTGITEGYLFPPEDSLKEIVSKENRHLPAAQTISLDHISYDSFLDVVQRTLSTHWSHIKWGTHSLRKTAFVLATWGGGGDIDIMKAARLKNLETVSTYRRDARTLRDMALARGWKFEHLVDEYRGQILLDLNFNQSLENENGTTLANWLHAFVAKYPRTRRSDGIAEMLNAFTDLTAIKSSLAASVADLRSILDNASSEYDAFQDQLGLEGIALKLAENLRALKNCRNWQIQEQVMSGERLDAAVRMNPENLVHVNVNVNVDIPVPASATATAPASPPAPAPAPTLELAQAPHPIPITHHPLPAPTQNFGPALLRNCDHRKGAMIAFAKTANVFAKLDILYRLLEDEPHLRAVLDGTACTTTLSKECKSFCLQTLKPIIQCLEEHHEGHRAIFAEAYRNINFSGRYFKKGCICVQNPV